MGVKWGLKAPEEALLLPSSHGWLSISVLRVLSGLFLDPAKPFQVSLLSSSQHPSESLFITVGGRPFKGHVLPL